ncbi:hypothetical protein FUAX_00070 [Fulvitalea axinellae]|uniref:Tetratricopeptide repeat protein n=1 Tax=Fulvitalea axinellae TaxID=1182444 RepID=A0AAU9D5Y0_9BACT|nr:hypothetical protein FUAX_00070 [Fulvitalea axinellae]
MYDHTEEAYKACREALKRDDLFAYELANLYVLTNRKEKMIDEYIGILKRNPDNINYIKGIWQRVLKTDEELEALETKLIQLSQKEQNVSVYNELLVWTYLQQKNFFGAFVQARSLEKRFNGRGERIYEIARIALANDEHETASEMYAYIVKNFPDSPYYAMARKSDIRTRATWVTNDYPINKEAIRKLTKDYAGLVAEMGNTVTAMESRREKALLHAFYLKEYDSAIADLEYVIKYPRAPRSLRMESKLSLGDMFVLTGEPWEASLLYSQVEKEVKDSPIAYKAKLKNAKLSYYKGEFELSKGHLDILKEATSREISNDAMALSLLIKDNTGLDSTETAMKRYAAIDLLMYQNRRQEALEAVEKMLYEFPGHSLEDELLYLKAKVLFEVGEFDQSVTALQKIVTEYSGDILTDDAYFMLGKVYETGKEDMAKAMDTYKELMVKYPGSVYTAEARKRYRKLRGDALR